MGIASTETFGYTLDVLMHQADVAVYAAKRQGRNRAIVATSRDTDSGVQAAAGGG
jgi:PleD family two-component response regulator